MIPKILTKAKGNFSKSVVSNTEVAKVSRVYVPNHYRVFLSPSDREKVGAGEGCG